jgi:hypothetical protein
MEDKYKLKSLGLSVSFSGEPPKMLPLDYTELYQWLKSNPSHKIIVFNYWDYIIDGREYHFKLNRGDGNIWNVYHLEKPDELYFSFDNPEGLKIKIDFERELRKTLWDEEMKKRKN